MKRFMFFLFVFILAITAPAVAKTNKYAGAAYRLVNAMEARRVMGGGGGSTIGRMFGKGGYYSEPVVNNPPINIKLGNVPYVSQYSSEPWNPRSAFWCGIASAVMVRAKTEKAFPFPSSLSGWESASAMQMIDENLQGGRYGDTIDVVNSRGLLYVSPYETARDQFNKTRTVLQNLYTAKWNDFATIDRGHVSGIDVKVLGDYGITAVDTIFNHIKDTRQPVVIIIDNSLFDYVNRNESIPYPRPDPVLHYNVVIGVNDNNRSREKNFIVFDPAQTSQPIEYSTFQLMTLMKLYYYSSLAWLISYGNQQGINEPCYLGLIQGD